MLRRGKRRGKEEEEERFGLTHSPHISHALHLDYNLKPQQNYKFQISWLEITQGPKAVKLTDSQLGSTGEIGHRAKNTYLCLSLFSLSL